MKKARQGSNPSVKYTAWGRSQTSLKRFYHALGEDPKQVNSVSGGKIVEVITPADTVILGFLPGELNVVFGTTGLVDALRGKLIVSLLPGVSYDLLAAVLHVDVVAGRDHHVLCVIPSLGAKINDSAALIAETAYAGHEQQKVASWMFQKLGQLQWLPE